MKILKRTLSQNISNIYNDRFHRKLDTDNLTSNVSFASQKSVMYRLYKYIAVLLILRMIHSCIKLSLFNCVMIIIIISYHHYSNSLAMPRDAVHIEIVIIREL